MINRSTSSSQLRPVHGFTLIEMMAVVVIVGILASVAAPRFYRAIMEAHLEEAKPYLMAIAAKEQAYYRRNGAYFDSNDENAISSTLGITLTDVSNFCFVAKTSSFLENSNPTFEVWAILRNGTVTSVAADSTGVTCTTVTGKLDASGWVGTENTVGGQGRVVVLRYPPTNGQSTTYRTGRTIFLNWVEGISTTDPLL
ncbi:MAG: prepilin-type N-terminal cleavage/methylation domain-containing protein [Magnetococcales bacterium]|nr:prepilin-type N-terminal cleavage/methylation domain-containing protein [Magnetococcales bacterium]